MRCLRGCGVDAPEQPRDVRMRLAKTESLSCGADDHGERVSHVMRNGSENRVAFGSKLALANRKPLGLELLFSLCRDEQSDGDRDGAEDQLVPPLIERGQSSREHDVITNDRGNGNGNRRARATQQCRRDDEQDGEHDVDVVLRGVVGRHDGECAAGENAGNIGDDLARETRHDSQAGINALDAATRR